MPTQVFDPRRTDPIHFGETVGRCLVCKNPHDDYDNGHAPSENKEARCNNCRMLILICNDCRPNYRCHGETPDDNNASSRPLLYCNINTCIHEGSTPDPELLVASSEGKVESIVQWMRDEKFSWVSKLEFFPSTLARLQFLARHFEMRTTLSNNRKSITVISKKLQL